MAPAWLNFSNPATENEEKLFFLLDSSPGYIAYVDAAELKYLFVNRRFEEGFQLGREEIIGRHVKEIIGESNYIFALKYIDEVRCGKTTSYENTFDLAEGKRWVKVNYSPHFDESGKVIGIVVLSYDITNLRRLETRLGQVRRLEAMGNLAGGIAHDFNNILGIIWGNVDLALMTHRSSDDSADLMESLSDIKDACRRGKGLVEQIQGFSRPKPAKPVCIDLCEFTSTALKLMKTGIPRGIRVTEDICTDPCPIDAEPAKLTQVIFNVVNNAAQAIDESGEITVRISRRPDEVVILEVSDTGPGVPPDLRERIFEPYFTTREEGEGTGLGLAVAYATINGHGGSIFVDDAPNGGARFTITLPLSSTPGEAAAACSSGPEHGNERLLIVDDEMFLLKTLVKSLKGFGYTVAGLDDPEAALELFRTYSSDYDAVVTDLSMPGMNGLALAAEIKKIRPDLPVLLITGYSNHLDEATLENAPIDGLIHKPFEVRELNEAIRGLFSAA